MVNMITFTAAAAAAAHGQSAASESAEMSLINAHSKLKPDFRPVCHFGFRTFFVI